MSQRIKEAKQKAEQEASTRIEEIKAKLESCKKAKEAASKQAQSDKKASQKAKKEADDEIKRLEAELASCEEAKETALEKAKEHEESLVRVSDGVMKFCNWCEPSIFPMEKGQEVFSKKRVNRRKKEFESRLKAWKSKGLSSLSMSKLDVFRLEKKPGFLSKIFRPGLISWSDEDGSSELSLENCLVEEETLLYRGLNFSGYSKEDVFGVMENIFKNGIQLPVVYNSRAYRRQDIIGQSSGVICDALRCSIFHGVVARRILH